MNFKTILIKKIIIIFMLIISFFSTGLMVIPGIHHLAMFDIITAVCILIFLLFLANFFLEKAVNLLIIPKQLLTFKKVFAINFCLMFLTVFCSAYMVLFFNRNNSDMLGWWQWVLLAYVFEGSVYAILYSFVALLAAPCKIYFITMALIFFIYFSWMFGTPVDSGFLYKKIIANLTLGWLIFIILNFIHLAWCIFWLTKKLHCTKFMS